MKDPAFLTYYQDFIVGAMFLTDEQLGAYWRILLHQADKYPEHMTLEEIKNICRTYETSWPVISRKFAHDDEGKFFNKRLEFEIKRRSEFCNSRRKNRLHKKHMKNICPPVVRHMENENEDENTLNISEYLRGVWGDYLEMRRRIRKPATVRAQELVLERLEKLAPSNEQQKKAILEQSIENSWQGVFALKEEGQHRGFGPRPLTQELLQRQMEAIKDR
jgi:uncharacterized protein YdaU (DUF1376 family)